MLKWSLKKAFRVTIKKKLSYNTFSKDAGLKNGALARSVFFKKRMSLPTMCVDTGPNIKYMTRLFCLPPHRPLLDNLGQMTPAGW